MKITPAKIRSALRRLWLYDSNRIEAKRNAKIGKKYRCCKCKKAFISKNVQVDHLEPVGTITDLNVYVSRLFVKPDELQVLCKKCHQLKTNQGK